MMLIRHRCVVLKVFMYIYFHNDELAQMILNPVSFEYFLAIENTQRTKPSWQRMNKLTN